MSSPPSNRNLPLPQYLSATLHPLLDVFTDAVSSSSPAAQTALRHALDELHLMRRMVGALGLYSDNEDAEELSERALVLMALGWVVGEVEGRVGGPEDGREGRLGALERSDEAYQGFMHLLGTYRVLSPEEVQEGRMMAESGARAYGDPARRREEKIRAYKREKELRGAVAAGLGGDLDASSSPIEFLLALLPTPPSTSGPSTSISASSSSSKPPSDDSSAQRPTILALLRLLHALTLAALQSNHMELELLRSAPASLVSLSSSASASAAVDARQSSRAADGDSDGGDPTWRLDMPAGAAGRARPRELISGGGRVLRPFTVLPSVVGLSERERLRGEVFRSGHRLPTMTVDEYLMEEERRGNFISGGGQASADAPTTSELLALAAENDGSREAEEKSEEKRLKDENWARYTDENAKGAGNTMNRG